MKKFFGIVLALSVLFLMPKTYVSAQSEDSSDVVSITVLHTNDIHARYAYNKKDKTIGFAKLKTIIKNESADIVLDAGDMYNGVAFSDLQNGISIAKLVNEVGYDAVAIGNHDWDYGADQLLNLEKISGTPIITGNVIDGNNNRFFKNQYIVKKVNGVNVGVFGVIDPKVSKPDGLFYEDMESYAKSIVSELKDKADIIICVAHCIDCSALAKINGIDLLITGHTHSLVEESTDNALVVEAGEYFENIGFVNLEYSKSRKQVVKRSSNFIPCILTETIPEDPDIASTIDSLNHVQKEKLSEVIGYTPVTLDGTKNKVSTEETNLGSVITDAYLKETGADVAFENSEFIKTSISRGAIKKSDVFNINPTGNYIVTKQLNGKELIDCLERSINQSIKNKKSYLKNAKPFDGGKYLQVGGITVAYDTSKPYGERIISAKIKNQNLDRNKVYTVASNNYLASHAFYPSLKNAPVIGEYSTSDIALINYIKSGQSQFSLKDTRMNNITNSSTFSPEAGDDSTISVFIMTTSAVLLVVLLLMKRKKSN